MTEAFLPADTITIEVYRYDFGDEGAVCYLCDADLAELGAYAIMTLDERGEDVSCPSCAVTAAMVEVTLG